MTSSSTGMHNDGEQRLLAEAHAAVRDCQRRLHALSEEARLLYQQRLGEWEQSRHSLQQLAAVLNAQEADPASTGQGPPHGIQRHPGLSEDEARLREKHGELAEKVSRLQRTVRLMATVLRHLEQESARLRRAGDGSLQSDGDQESQADSQDRIIQAYEQERQRLAREIHDGPAQILANAIFELEYFERLIDKDPSSVKSQLAQFKSDMRDGLTEVRRFIFDLRPPSLGDMGLFVALRRYLEDYERHFGIAVESDLPQLRERLPTTKEVALFRIVQEALQNVQKHAAASRVTVKGEIDSGVLRLCVEDDGRGFDLTEVARRHSRNLGLTSMRERAGLIDAQLQIVTAPDRGTRITVSVPLESGGT